MRDDISRKTEELKGRQRNISFDDLRRNTTAVDDVLLIRPRTPLHRIASILIGVFFAGSGVAYLFLIVSSELSLREIEFVSLLISFVAVCAILLGLKILAAALR